MRMAQDLTGLIYHPGWSVLKEINENNIEFLDAQIIKKMDPDGKPLTETQCDELRIKRDYLDRKSTRLNSSHIQKSRMPSSA